MAHSVLERRRAPALLRGAASRSWSTLCFGPSRRDGTPRAAASACLAWLTWIPRHFEKPLRHCSQPSPMPIRPIQRWPSGWNRGGRSTGRRFRSSPGRPERGSMEAGWRRGPAMASASVGCARLTMGLGSRSTAFEWRVRARAMSTREGKSTSRLRSKGTLASMVNARDGPSTHPAPGIVRRYRTEPWTFSISCPAARSSSTGLVPDRRQALPPSARRRTEDGGQRGARPTGGSRVRAEWAGPGSNRRQPVCKTGALPTELPAR